MSPKNGNGIPSTEQEASDMPEHASQRITLERIMAAGAAYAGRTVTVEGSFRGWKSPCPTSVSITRSDWILDDGTGCIYVSGCLPSSLSASAPRGERVMVSGKVMLIGDGKMNLQATAVRVLDGDLDHSMQK